MDCPAAMRNAISEVLETMFFVVVDFVDTDDTDQTGDRRSNIMLFNDIESLNVAFRMTEPFAKMIAANFLGSSEEEITGEEVEDVMKELANMVGGNYMGRMEQENWQLGIPSIGDFEECSDGMSQELVLSFLGEHVGGVVLRTDTPSKQL